VFADQNGDILTAEDGKWQAMSEDRKHL